LTKNIRFYGKDYNNTYDPDKITKHLNNRHSNYQFIYLYKFTIASKLMTNQIEKWNFRSTSRDAYLFTKLTRFSQSESCNPCTNKTTPLSRPIRDVSKPNGYRRKFTTLPDKSESNGTGSLTPISRSIRGLIEKLRGKCTCALNTNGTILLIH
jgi:hypothetical protein